MQEDDKRKPFPLDWYHPQYFNAFDYFKDFILNIDASYFAQQDKIYWDKFDIYSTILFTPDDASNRQIKNDYLWYIAQSVCY